LLSTVFAVDSSLLYVIFTPDQPGKGFIVQGIILTGGRGTRLMPLTKDTNKHLLDLCGRPMVYYSLSILVSAGVTDVTLVTNPDHVKDFDSTITGNFRGQFDPFRVVPQTDKPGIAGSIQMMPEDNRIGPYMVVLGDNIIGGSISSARDKFFANPDQALIVLSEVTSPESFGVAHIEEGKLLAIEEKPEAPESHWAITGIYFFPDDLFEIAAAVEPSARGEFEVTDILSEYLRQKRLKYHMLEHWWIDAGTHESLAEAKKMICRESEVEQEESKS
jgi:glucose-1-phosphate thymidylyltransferase